GIEPARVTLRHSQIYRVSAERGDLLAEVAGRLRHHATGAHELPAVGDWVAIKPAGAGKAIIRAVLPRSSKFSRKAAGRVSEEQVVAANVDTVLLVAGLDNDYSPRRIERYLVMAYESGAVPVVVLNKADLCPDAQIEARAAEVRSVALGVPVHIMSAAGGAGLEQLARYVVPGRTAALLGSSGVGKSTIINRLLGADALPTRPVREHDQTGRHATTHRELLIVPPGPLTPEGGLIIDTPGMRELQLWDAGEGMHAAFDEIQTLAAACRFSGCSHHGEPGCAVEQAVIAGGLAAERLESFRKLQRELAWQETRIDKWAELERKRKWKTIHKAARKYVKPRDSG